ncbi:heme NO-binding domain-containing protein [Novosphingobium beihaiensis]|uniref:Heme NO-binding domain-containing protein n=1 Tax=Novosphingobium beihaiensis TaxID=2930389 RepID=A0ABT0BM78_9SPHN|nr:heme NO-binding domain-containing protein [Novosphingobium beihaiensis]MCJ2186160.1 heme NO-binding domain-containing protein [Novosphingobium beihaiensis]
MKGIVFTEFLEHVESAFGVDVLEDMIERSEVPSGGAYTSVGTYDHAEMGALIAALSSLTQTPAADLVHRFGISLGTGFSGKFESFFQEKANLFDFLESVESHIHVEVKKLYPDAELPSLVMVERSPEAARLRYRSPRNLDELAAGLIVSSAAYYNDSVTVTREPGEDTDGPFVDIVVIRQPQN